MKFFERFDAAYCISLDKRQDRKDRFLEEVKKYDLGNFKFYQAIDGQLLDLKEISNKKTFNPKIPLGNIGLILTTLKLIDDAIKNKFSTILLMEDDCIFTDEILNIQSYIDLVPNDWDILYFGGNHYSNAEMFKINDKVLKISMTHMAHCISIKSHMFEIIKNELEKFRTENDNVYMELQKKYNVYCIYPSVAKQIDGHSDIVNGYVNYLGLVQ